MTGSKDCNGWPDLDSWIRELSNKLHAHDHVFLTLEKVASGRSTLTQEEEEALGIVGVVDPSDIPHQYARIVSRIIEALQQLPAFAESNGLFALTALRMDLVALDEGSRPRRLMPRPQTSVGAANIGNRIFKAHTIECVRLFEELGLSQTESLRRVAKIFSKQGHRGKAGKDLSAATLYRWREDFYGCPSPAYEVGREKIEAKIAQWRADPDWPPSLDDAAEYARLKASNPAFSLALTT